MRKLLLITLVFFGAACGSDGSSETTQGSETTTKVPGNSGGSDIIGMDTARMDTGSSSIATDKIK